jgi:hypothetical protein
MADQYRRTGLCDTMKKIHTVVELQCPVYHEILTVTIYMNLLVGQTFLSVINSVINIGIVKRNTFVGQECPTYHEILINSVLTV